MNGVVSRIAHDLVEFTGKPHADEFIELQKQWAALTESQCLHQRGLYGRGTMGGVSQANCLQRLFERRTEDLEALYRDVLSLLSLPE